MAETSATAAVADDQSPEAVADRQGTTTSPSDALPFFRAPSPEPTAVPEPQPYVADPVPVTTASMADAPAASDDRIAHTLPHQVTAGAASSASGTAASMDEPATWEAAVADSGEATARVPEPRAQEPELDSAQKQIVTVAGWLDEAEDAGKKLSGAEVARRLDVAPPHRSTHAEQGEGVP